jgi:hypothetical protein
MTCIRRGARVAARLLPTAIVLSIPLACSAPADPPGEEHAAPPVPGGARSGHERMVAVLDEVRRRSAVENPYVGNGERQRLAAKLAALDPSAPLIERIETMAQLGVAELVLGREREAIERMDSARKLVGEGRTSNQLDLMRAVAYLRLGETQNCCLRRSPDSCIMPIQGGGIHTDTEGSLAALAPLEAVLRATQPGEGKHLEALWLYDIAAMTLGRWPDEVSKEWLVPPEALESDEPFPRFPNTAARLGIDTVSISGGAIADDFDGDDDLDLVVSSADPSEQIRLWRNEGDGTFADRTAEAGLTGLYGGLNLVQADYDNDGDRDVLVLRGAWLFERGRIPSSLLRNDGGRFTDVSFEAGIAEPAFPTQTGSWADYDRDGDVDLYIGHESTPRQVSPSKLLRNEGDGTFVDVAAEAGVTNMRFAKGVVWGDYDNDGWPDLYVSNLNEDNRLYRNLGHGTFEDVAPRLGVTEPLVSFPVWFWDFDNDGNLDLFVSAYASRIEHVAASYLGLPVEEGRLMRLYRGDGRGGFEEVARRMGLVRAASPMGSNFGDLDNDGWLDFYLGTGDPDLKNLMPNLMFRNREGQNFADVTMAGGFGHLQKGHAVVFADLDADGDQDVFEQMGGAYLADKYADVLYENPGFGRHWIGIELVGTRANRAAIGARLELQVVDGGRKRSLFRTVSSGGSFGANPLRQTVGIGAAERVERLEIHWPGSGTTQTLESLPVDRLIRIIEGRDGFETVALAPTRLGAVEP